MKKLHSASILLRVSCSKCILYWSFDGIGRSIIVEHFRYFHQTVWKSFI